MSEQTPLLIQSRTQAPKDRICGDFVSAFCELYKGLPTNPVFVKAAALATIAGAVGRRVWAETLIGIPLYPNTYTILIASPGIGKSVIIGRTKHLWQSTQLIHIPPNDATKAAWMDSMADYGDSINLGDGKLIPYTQMAIALSEFESTIGNVDSPLLSFLIDLYDNLPVFAEKKRSMKVDYHIENPSATLIGGTTPASAGGIFPGVNFEKGFPTRVVWVYADVTRELNFFQENEGICEREEQKLARDLQAICGIHGKFLWTKGAMDTFSDIARGKLEETRITYSRFLDYNTRRHLHLGKFCQLFAISRSQELVIQQEDVEKSWEWMQKYEKNFGILSQTFSQTSHSSLIDEVGTFFYCKYKERNKPIPMQEVLSYLFNRVGSQNSQYLESMIGTGVFKKSFTEQGQVLIPCMKEKKDV